MAQQLTDPIGVSLSGSNVAAALEPVLAMVGLTLIVLLYLYSRRIPAMLKHDLDPEALKKDPSLKEKLPDSARFPSANLINLFEVPVLFYVVAISAIILGLADATHIMLAWAYVGLRAAHSLIHCTYNRVMHRFIVFALSGFVLLALYIRLVMGFLSL